MRWSYTLLLTSGLMIVVDRILKFIPTVGYGFLGIPGQLSQYPANIVYFVFYASLLAFVNATYGKLSTATRTFDAATSDQKDKSPDPGLIAGVALSAFCSILFVIVLAAHKGDIPKQSVGWLLFVLISGLLINSKSPISFSARIALSSIPALAFFLYTLGFLALAYILGGDFVISGPTEKMTMDDVVKYGLVGFAIGFAAIPAIVAASLARDQVFVIVTATSKLSPEVLTRLKGNISLILGILTIIGVAILGHGLTQE